MTPSCCIAGTWHSHSRDERWRVHRGVRCAAYRSGDLWVWDVRLGPLAYEGCADSEDEARSNAERAAEALADADHAIVLRGGQRC